MIDGQVGDNYPKKFGSKKTYPLFFGGVRTRDSQSIYMGYFSLFFFLLSFCNKAV